MGGLVLRCSVDAVAGGITPEEAGAPPVGFAGRAGTMQRKTAPARGAARF